MVLAETWDEHIDGPPSWKRQLQTILSANAKGTVEEFHALLASLRDEREVGTGFRLTNPEFVCLCAAVLSAQTRDRTAINGIQQLANMFGLPRQRNPTAPDFSPAALALAPLGSVEDCLRGVNYFKTKARRLRDIAALLLSRHCGRVPSTFTELTLLPGVGSKIANLVLNAAFGQEDAGMIVDTHVHRVSKRLGWSRGNDPETTRKDLERFIPAQIRGLVTLRLISFGQEICRPQHPKCNSCPVSREALCPTYTRFHGEQHTVHSSKKRPAHFRQLRCTKSRRRVLIEIEDT